MPARRIRHCRTSQGVRELKFGVDDKNLTAMGRTPQGVRELKYLGDTESALLVPSYPA